jgi:IS30 family transposase
MRAVGHSICAIAGALQRAKSTVSRELRRNALPSGRYSPLHAAGAYQLRRRREAILEKDPTLRTFVRDRLAEGWAPEQIAGWLKAGNERGLRALGFEAIYAFIYRAAHKGEDLWRYLTRRHKHRRPRRSRPSRDTIKDRVSIHQRPKNIDARTEAGHWEGESSASARGPCSFSMSANPAWPSLRGSPERRPPRPSRSCWRSSLA